MFCVEISAAEQHLFSLPLQFGGLRICNPVSLASHLFNSSVCGTKHLIISIVELETFQLDSHFDCISFNRLHYHQQLNTIFDEEFGQLLALFDSIQ